MEARILPRKFSCCCSKKARRDPAQEARVLPGRRSYYFLLFLINRQRWILSKELGCSQASFLIILIKKGNRNPEQEKRVLPRMVYTPQHLHLLGSYTSPGTASPATAPPNNSSSAGAVLPEQLHIRSSCTSPIVASLSSRISPHLHFPALMLQLCDVVGASYG